MKHQPPFSLKFTGTNADEYMVWLVYAGGHGCPPFFNMHGRAIIICILLGTGVPLAGPAGYLARVGPAELRFAIDDPPLPEVPLPPLPPIEATQPMELDTPVPPAPESTDSEPGTEQNPVTTPAVTSQTDIGLPSPVEPSRTNPPITPKMFIEFFKPDAPGVQRGVIVVPDVGFSPASPPQSSSATFTQPKK